MFEKQPIPHLEWILKASNYARISRQTYSSNSAFLATSPVLSDKSHLINQS